VSPEYSYSLFLRHYVIRSQFFPPRFGESVAELGPGSSLGFGDLIKINNIGMVREAIDGRADWLASHSVLEHVEVMSHGVV
jgi:hypothetical protein